MRVGPCPLRTFHGQLPVGVDTAAGQSTQLTASADWITQTEQRGPLSTVNNPQDLALGFGNRGGPEHAADRVGGPLGKSTPTEPRGPKTLQSGRRLPIAAPWPRLNLPLTSAIALGIGLMPRLRFRSVRHTGPCLRNLCSRAGVYAGGGRMDEPLPPRGCRPEVPRSTCLYIFPSPNYTRYRPWPRILPVDQYAKNYACCLCTSRPLVLWRAPWTKFILWTQSRGLTSSVRFPGC